MSGKTQKVKDALLRCPSLIPSLLRDKDYDYKTTRGILYNLIPRRTSIEIECFGNLGHGAIPNDSYWYNTLESKYNVLSITKDANNYREYEEHKISIRNYSQAYGLYQVLELMKTQCQINKDSGCHIHIDITDICDKILRITNTYASNYLTGSKRHSTIQSFFNKYIQGDYLDNLWGKYDGSYNAKCFTFSKRGVISLRTDLNSIEFRSAPQSFEYTEIIKWFIGCNKIINQFSRLVDQLLIVKQEEIKTPEGSIPIYAITEPAYYRHLSNCCILPEERINYYMNDARQLGLEHFHNCTDCNPPREVYEVLNQSLVYEILNQPL